MKTIKIIDLFVKIANGENFKAIKLQNMLFYYRKNANGYFNDNDELLEDYILLDELNDEVEIIKEEKKLPEKWNDLSFTTMIKKGDSIDNDINRLKGYIRAIMRTQNEIIDYLKSKEKGE